MREDPEEADERDGDLHKSMYVKAAFRCFDLSINLVFYDSYLFLEDDEDVEVEAEDKALAVCA